MTYSVHTNNNVFSIMLTQERHSVPEKLFLNYSGWSIRPCACLSVFVPAHFWPSLKHLFSRCCSWQALHDIKSEILTENQTASRPLAVPIHRLFFAAQICMFFVFLSQTCNSLWHGTNYFIIIHCVFCLPFSALDPEGMSAVSKLHEYSSLYIIVPAELAIS